MAQISILYIDDSPAQLASVREALAPRGFLIKTAQNLTEAIAQLDAGPVDVVLIDYIMPGQSGAEVLRALKQRGGAPSTRYFLYTTDTKATLDYHAMGFDGALIMKGHNDV